MPYFSDNLKQIIFDFKQLVRKNKPLQRYRKLKKHQFLSQDQIYDINWDKRKKLIKYAYNNTKFYHDLYKKPGIEPDDIIHPEDFENLPVVKREDLRHRFNDLISRDVNLKNLILSTTGGSTGIPVKVYFDKKIPLEPYAWLMLDWWDLKPSVNMAIIYRLFRTKWHQKAINTLIWWPTLRTFLDASHMTEDNIKKFIRDFNRIKPYIVQGYVGGVYQIAKYISDKNISIYKPKAVWVTSSPITKSQEIFLEEVFGAPVYDLYGCCEMFWLSAQCRERKWMHMFFQSRYIEFVDNNGKTKNEGEYGNILITDLDNYVFPLIRYENGDIGRKIKGVCSCGINLPLMDRVKGRTSDLIKLPDGSCIAGEYLTTIFDDYPDSVIQFRVHQEKDYSIILYYVPNKNYNNINLVIADVRKKLLRKIDNQTTVTFKQVPNIQHDRGKLHFITSDLQ